MSRRVRFEPIKAEIECGDDETLLAAATRGGCSEPDNYRLEIPMAEGRGTVTRVEALTQDIAALELRVDEPTAFVFKPGQFVDLHIPGTADSRAFSIANLPGEGQLEFIIKRYRDGAFSGLFSSGDITRGTELGFSGPHGALHLRRSDLPVLCIGGGTGTAAIQALLRQLAAEQSARTVRFFYAGRTRADLFNLDLIATVGEEIADFEFIPVLADPADDDHWHGETGFVHEAVGRFLSSVDVGRFESYMAGPPAMIDDAIEVLVDGHGVDMNDIHYDKFTMTSGRRAATR